MDDIPPPVNYHFSLNGFKHASSSHIYDWVNDVDNSREARVGKLREMDSHQDYITPAQKKWVKKQREIRGIQMRGVDMSLLRDESEVYILRTKLR